MTVGKCCSREVVVTGKDTSLVEAAKLMREYHVGSLVVTERAGDVVRPVGIITDRDMVVEVLAEEVEPDALTVEDVMSPDPLTLYEDDEIYEALERMSIRGVRRAPIVDHRKGLVGLLSIDDVLWSLSRELGDITNLVARQPKTEARIRAAS